MIHTRIIARFLILSLPFYIFSANVNSAPYFITYTSTISFSGYPEIINGESYTLTFVVDNGGTTTSNQIWNAADLQCAHWSMNNAGNVRFEHDLSGAGEIAEIFGAIETDAGGALVDNFTSVISDPATPAAYTAIGFIPPDPIGWYANSNNQIFYSPTYVNSFSDAAGGVQMAVVNWSNPQPYVGVGCAAAVPPVVTPRSIPTLTEWGVILLSGLLSIGAIFALRGRSA